MRETLIVTILIMVCTLILPTGAQAQNSGYYLPYIYYDVLKSAEAIGAGDFNNDGLTDIVVTDDDSETNYGIYIFFQSADGTLGTPVLYQNCPACGPDSVSGGDVNNDGRDDVIQETGTGIAVRYQNASGTLDDPVYFTTGTTNKLRIGDLNNDGLPDVVTHGWGESSVFVLFQDGAGSFDAAEEYTLENQGYNDLEIGDVNDDGLNDIVASSGQGSETEAFGVILQTGAGFGAPTYYASVEPADGLAIGDLNNDSLNDIVTNDSWTDQIHVYLQNGGGTLDAEVNYDTAGSFNHPMAVTDTNQDGRMDAVGAGSTRMSVYHQKADGTLDTAEIYTLPYATWLNPHGMMAVDVNNNGRDDIIFANYNYGMVVLYDWDGTETIGVHSPSGGAVLTMGDSFVITWGSIGNIDRVLINYSVDGGNSWVLVADDQPNDGSYSWTVPFTPSTNCRIRISDMDGYPVGRVSLPFSIQDDGVDRLTVTSPNGTENWAATNTYTISWTTTGSISDVSIDYSTNNGTAWTSITASTSNDGSYAWTVPDTVSAQCLVRISDAADSDPTDSSNAVFSIVSADTDTINVTYPNGGESLNGGSPYTITWNSSGTVFNVRLEYSTNNGSTWNLINATAPNSGSYSWTVPNTPSTQCLVRVRDQVDNDPSDTSNAVFTISSSGPGPGGDSITVTSPNGGESAFVSTVYDIKWTSIGAIGNVKIDYSTNNGSSWKEVTASTANTGSYEWSVPNDPSTTCKVRVSRISGSALSDASNSTFTILPQQPGITMLTPLGGEEWQVGTVHNITWKNFMTVGNVKIEYSTNGKQTWQTIASSVTNNLKYSWTIPNTPSTNCYVRLSEASDGTPNYTNYKAFSIVTDSPVPAISLSRTDLFFATMKSSSAVTGVQKIRVENSANGTMKWTCSTNADWFRVDNKAGTETGIVGVSVNTLGIGAGTYEGIITFRCDEASNSPQTVTVNLKVYSSGTDQVPFGSFDSPADGSTVMSSVPVTGWALDDIGIKKVSIYRDAVQGEGSGEVYIGQANLVDGARPDVEGSYPAYPMNYQAGWGYMLLTNMLPGGGNGWFKLHAYAEDQSGNKTYLGYKSINCDNNHAVKPFGAIDAPSQGGIASGTSFRNQGWVLTPMPDSIATNGSTINVFIDGVSIGNPTYNIYREDIADLFPGYANSNGSLAYLDFDTTAYKTGLHTIQWTARDSGGDTDGIGSRYFNTENSGYNNDASGSSATSTTSTFKTPEFPRLTPTQFKNLKADRSTRFSYYTGYDDGDNMNAAHIMKAEEKNSAAKASKASKALQPKELIPAADGVMRLNLREMQRLVLNLGRHCAGYLKVGEQLRPLPIGSTLDHQNGKFYWQLGSAFLGKYRFLFIIKNKDGKTFKQEVEIDVSTKFKKS